jgi:hypothetical protein
MEQVVFMVLVQVLLLHANNGTQATFQLTQVGVGNWLKYLRVSDSSLVEQFGGTDLLALTTSGNLGLGVTPSSSTVKTFEIGAVGNGLINGGTADIYLAAGAYYNSGWKYALTSTAVASYEVGGGTGTHNWKIAASGTAGNPFDLDNCNDTI